MVRNRLKREKKQQKKKTAQEVGSKLPTSPRQGEQKHHLFPSNPLADDSVAGLLKEQTAPGVERSIHHPKRSRLLSLRDFCRNPSARPKWELEDLGSSSSPIVNPNILYNCTCTCTYVYIYIYIFVYRYIYIYTCSGMFKDCMNIYTVYILYIHTINHSCSNKSTPGFWNTAHLDDALMELLIKWVRSFIKSTITPSDFS